MKHITGFKKDVILAVRARTGYVRKLPLSVQAYLNSTFRHEKLTRMDGRYVIHTFLPPFPGRAFEQLTRTTAAIYEGRAAPYSTYLSLTDRCGFRCWHCSKELREGKELTTEEWIRVARELQDHGICLIGFTGGEPLWRRDLEEIVRSIDERSATILFSTGDGLTDERAGRLKEAGLTYVAISLDHYDPEKHNRLRGSPKAFDTAVRAIRTALAGGFYTAVQLTATKDLMSDGEMDRFIGFVRELGAQEIRLVEPMPTGRLMEVRGEALFGEKERQLLKEYHIKTKKVKDMPKVVAFAYIEDEDLYGCGAGVQHMYVDAFGNLCPCDFTPLSFGNLKEEGFETPFARLHKAFGRPRGQCFILSNADKIRAAFKGKLPLGYDESLALCARCSQGGIPEFYKQLGWKEGEDNNE